MSDGRPPHLICRCADRLQRTHRVVRSVERCEGNVWYTDKVTETCCLACWLKTQPGATLRIGENVTRKALR